MRRHVVLVLAVALIGGGAVTWWLLRDRDPRNRRSAAWMFLFNCPGAAKLVGAPTSDEAARAVLPRVSCRREKHGEACMGAVRATDGARGTLRLSLGALGETRGVTLELGGRSIDLGTCNAREQMRQCGTGKAVACFELASWHARGNVVARDLKLARLLAETGCLIDVDSCRTLLPPELEGSDRGYREALDRLARSSAACRGGEARACRTVAEQLEQGRGVARDPAAAVRFLEQARRLEGAASSNDARTGLFYLQPEGDRCRWMVLDLGTRGRQELARSPCPRALALHLGERRFLYAKGAEVHERRGESPRFSALPRPPVGKEGIERVWIGSDGTVRVAHLKPVEKSALSEKDEKAEYRFEGRRVRLEDDAQFFGGMAIQLKLEASRWVRVEAVPSFGGPDDTATVAPLKEVALASGSVAAHPYGTPTPDLESGARLAASSPEAAALLKKTYQGAQPDRVEVLSFGKGSSLLAYSTGRGHTGPVTLCRDRCARSAVIFTRRDDGDLGDVTLSREGRSARVRYGEDLAVFDDGESLAPILELKFREALDAWVRLPR